MKYKILVTSACQTQSGYGEHSRFLLRALRSRPDLFDIYVKSLPWGKCGHIPEDSEERAWIEMLIKKTALLEAQGHQVKYDIHAHVGIANEWTRMAPYSICITAGIETTKVSAKWIEKSHEMDKLIVPSQHGKQCFLDQQIEAHNRETGEKLMVGVGCPIDIVSYPVKEVEPEPKFDLDLDYDFNYLIVAQSSPRKNMTQTIKWFTEEFKDEEVGLIVKTNLARNSTMDYHRLITDITGFINTECADRGKCKVYVLHGDLSEEEMTALYRHEKVKAIITTSHGEGFGLPLFEAAYNDLPVIAPDWSGQVDFLYAPQKDKRGKLKLKKMYASVDYDLKPVQKAAHWQDIIVPDSKWAFPKRASFKRRLRDIRKDYNSWKSRAKKLGTYLRDTLTEKNQLEEFVEAVAPNSEASSSEYLFVSDFFTDQVQGGAEMSLQALIDSCPSTHSRVNTAALSKDLFEIFKDSKWIFGNIANIDPQYLKLLQENKIDYSFVEFDYKFCKYRNPSLYEFVEKGELCDYKETERGQLIEEFVQNARTVFFMSEKQREVYFEHLPALAKRANTHILSSVFDNAFFDVLTKLRMVQNKNDKWLVQGSNSWVKGVMESANWCEENNKPHEIIGGLNYLEFLTKVNNAKGVCFLPKGMDTCPRFIIEAKLLGCELQLNEHVQHAGEDWFEGDIEDAIDYLKTRRDFFWMNAFRD